MDTGGVEVPVGPENRRRLVFPGSALAIIDDHVSEARSRFPAHGMFDATLVITQFEPGDGFALIEPDDQVKVGRGKPATARFSGMLGDTDPFPHDGHRARMELQLDG